MQTEIQFQDAMSRERFWQEVALRFSQMGFRSLFDRISDPDFKGFTEKDVQDVLKTIARHSFDAADLMVERHGPDSIPRTNVTSYSRAVK